MKLTGKIQNILNIPKSTNEQQTEITVTEAWHLWQNILQKCDIIKLTQILQTYANDADLRAVLASGLRTLQNEAKLNPGEAIPGHRSAGRGGGCNYPRYRRTVH